MLAAITLIGSVTAVYLPETALNHRLGMGILTVFIVPIGVRLTAIVAICTSPATPHVRTIAALVTLVSLGTPFVWSHSFAAMYTAWYLSTVFLAALLPWALCRFTRPLSTPPPGATICSPQPAPLPGTTPGQGGSGISARLHNTNPWAVLALLLPVISGSAIIACLAIVLGHVALSQITRTAQSGRAVAIAGLTAAYFTAARQVELVTVWA